MVRKISKEFKNYKKAFKITFSTNKRIFLGILLGLFMASMSIMLPVLLTPGNTLSFQLSIMSHWDILLTLLFATLFGVAMSMQIYALRQELSYGSSTAKSAGSSLFAFVGTLFSSNLCPMCLATILGFIGIGGTAAITLRAYRTEILVGSIIVLITINVFAARRVSKVKKCKTC